MLAKKLIAAAGNAGGDKLYVEDVFSTYLYTGTVSDQNIVNGIDLSTEGGMVWIKRRDGVKVHALFDTERGTNTPIASDLGDSETTQPGISNSLKAFNTDGFTLGGNNTVVNSNTGPHASWTFRKAEKFFDVVTYTGNGVAGRTIAHNLGSTPGCIFVKRRDGGYTSYSWAVYHKDNTANPETDYLTLDTNATTADDSTFWNDTAPTSSVFSVGTNDRVNANGAEYLAYLFASDAGGFGDDGSESIIKCGSFSFPTSGTVNVNVGFEPQLVIWKDINHTQNWYMLDTMRGWAATNGGVSGADGPASRLFPDLSNAESPANFGGLNSTGFTCPSNLNYGDGNTDLIYIAIRRPMKTPESGTEVFAPFTYDNSAGGFTQTQNVGFPTDIALEVDRVATSTRYTTSRLQGPKNQMGTQSYSPESDYNTYVDQQKYDLQNLFAQMNAITSSVLLYCFRRATKFSDVVGYIGNGVSNTTQTHNLGAVPEMMIIKARTAYQNWVVYHKDIGNTGVIVLNQDAASVSSSTYFNNTTPTSTIFTLGSSGTTNANTNPYIAYLFSTLAGVSKVGSYTGTGSNVNVDCGFSTGARFILIKRKDSTGDWYVWDSARGITAGSDAYLLLNSTSPETTSTDYIDPLSSGFTVTSSAPAGLNASGGTYIFLAIA